MEAITKKSIVTQVDYKTSSENNYGPVHYFAISFENGDKGDYGAKTNPQTTFVVGQEVQYTITTKVNGDYTNHYIKPVAVTNGYKGGRRQENVKAANAREALRSATMLVMAGNYPVNQLAKVRDKFYTWLNEHSV